MAMCLRCMQEGKFVSDCETHEVTLTTTEDEKDKD
jgi:hypothetical protein